MEIIAVKDNVHYKISYSAYEDNYYTYYAIIQEMISSFENI